MTRTATVPAKRKGGECIERSLLTVAWLTSASSVSIKHEVKHPNHDLEKALLLAGVNVADFSDLSPSERAAKYRQLAQDALREAANAHLSVRDSYIILAERWESLALTVESDAQGEKRASS